MNDAHDIRPSLTVFVSEYRDYNLGGGTCAMPDRDMLGRLSFTVHGVLPTSADDIPLDVRRAATSFAFSSPVLAAGKGEYGSGIDGSGVHVQFNGYHLVVESRDFVTAAMAFSRRLTRIAAPPSEPEPQPVPPPAPPVPGEPRKETPIMLVVTWKHIAISGGMTRRYDWVFPSQAELLEACGITQTSVRDLQFDLRIKVPPSAPHGSFMLPFGSEHEEPPSVFHTGDYVIAHGSSYDDIRRGVNELLRVLARREKQ